MMCSWGVSNNPWIWHFCSNFCFQSYFNWNWMHLSFCKYLVQSNLWNVNPSAFLLANTPDREIEWNVSNKSFPTDFKQIRIGNETSLAGAAAATFDWSVGSSSPFELHNCGHPWIHVSHAITRMLYSGCQTCCTYQLNSKVLIAFIYLFMLTLL